MKEESSPASKRLLLKLSGEVLAGSDRYGLDSVAINQYSKVIVDISNAGRQIGIVVGAGNFIRGRAFPDMDRVTVDQMGMTATVINALALMDSIRKCGGTVSVLSTIVIAGSAESYSPKVACNLLNSGHIVIYAGGTGNAYLTTDTAAALRAVQTDCNILLKGTKVDGIYSTDPNKDSSARRFDVIDYNDVLRLELKVMDAAAIAICRDNALPISIFDIRNPENIVKILDNPALGSIVKEV